MTSKQFQAFSRPKRILNEFKNVQKKSSNAATDEFPFEFYCDENDISIWKVIYSGSIGTLYHGSHWLIFVQFPEEYPNLAPMIRFFNKIYHPNINQDGRICHEILSSKWSPSVDSVSIFSNIKDMLKDPNPDDALEREAAQLYKDYKENKKNVSYNVDNDPYVTNLRSWKKDFAFTDKNELKMKFNLNDE